jgi:alkylation response protein AidB-like acyl-CoA dehydrogenase
MVEGVWSGTMCLTEPHSGTDLGLLTTKAVAAGDGTYKISGEKIFITSGDHDLTENILHLVNGSLGDRKGVQTTAIEHKMGIRASATCSLNFVDATGYLIGEENRGLAAMFKMMNIERITVGLQGLGMADIAYQNALDYAVERRQSKAPAPRPDDKKAADPIIFQPEMQRQLLTIRSQVEGARALSAFAGLQVDIMEKSADADEASAAEALVALLTPVIKAHFSDLGMSSTLSAQQIYGGHGYIREHGMEQLVRDCRIAPIYEGTNEVQAIDLAARKVSGRQSEFANKFLADWQAFLAAQSHDDTADIIGAAATALQQLVETTQWVQKADDAAQRGAASQYLRQFGLTLIACLWAQIIVSIRDKKGTFYDTKRKLARFYMQQVLPETASIATTIVNGADALADISVSDLTD